MSRPLLEWEDYLAAALVNPRGTTPIERVRFACEVAELAYKASYHRANTASASWEAPELVAVEGDPDLAVLVKR